MGCLKLQLNQCFRIIRPEENNYTYDALNRLTKEVSQCADNAELAYTDEYTYDLVGNRLKKVHTADVNETIDYTYNHNDQLISETSSTKGTTAYTYDANGSMTSKVNTQTGDSYGYTYNLQNRLATATISRMETDPLGGPSKLVDITSAYVYNQSGIRVGASTSTKIDGGAPEVKNTVYLTDPANFTGYSQVVEEKVNGVLEKAYSLGDDVLAQTVSGVTSYLQYDGHGSTRLLTSASSAVSARYNYDAYGKNLFSANVTNPSATDMLYSGEQFDPNLQMQYLRARYYDQNNGRFNRVDDYMGDNYDPQSLHKYAYTHCNPVMGIDPSGMSNWSLASIQASMSIMMTNMYNYLVGLSATLFMTLIKLEQIFWATMRVLQYINNGLLIFGAGLKFLDVTCTALLNNTSEIPENQFARGVFIEEKAKVNLGGNFPAIDDFREGQATQFKTRSLATQESLISKISQDARKLQQAGTKPLSGYSSYRNGHVPVTIMPGQMKTKVLITAIPQNQISWFKSPAFRQALINIQKNTRVVIRVVPVKGWKRK